MRTNARTTLLLTLAAITVAAGLVAGWGRVLAAPRGHGPIGAQITVSMTDDEGDPVPGATITVRDEGDQLVHRTTTDSQGSAMANLGPAAGRYRVLAELPATATDLVPHDDTDGPHTPSPRGTCPDWRLCVTFDQDAAGTVSLPGVHPSRAGDAAAHFDVRDTAPEPRLSFTELDVTGQQPQPLPGGTVTIARLRRDGSTEAPSSRRFQTQSVLFDGLTAGTYRVEWAPPAGYTRVTAQVHQVTVTKMTARSLRARRATEGASSWGEGRDATVVPVRVWIHDVTNGQRQPFSGGVLELFHLDEDGAEHRLQADATFGARFDLPGGAVVEYAKVPAGYELVGPREDVADAAQPDVVFEVRRIRPRTGDDGVPHGIDRRQLDRPPSPPASDPADGPAPARPSTGSTPEDPQPVDRPATEPGEDTGSTSDSGHSGAGDDEATEQPRPQEAPAERADPSEERPAEEHHEERHPEEQPAEEQEHLEAEEQPPALDG